MKVIVRKPFLFLMLLASLISLPGCEEDEEIDLSQVHIAAHGEGAKGATARITEDFIIKEAYGYTKPYVPIREPAEIRKVWIPDHIGTDECLVSGHWVYIVIKKDTWYIEEPRYEKMKPPVIIPRKGILEEFPVAPEKIKEE